MWGVRRLWLVRCEDAVFTADGGVIAREGLCDTGWALQTTVSRWARSFCQAAAATAGSAQHWPQVYRSPLHIKAHRWRVHRVFSARRPGEPKPDYLAVLADDKATWERFVEYRQNHRTALNWWLARRRWFVVILNFQFGWCPLTSASAVSWMVW